jgi:hypothetical protein
MIWRGDTRTIHVLCGGAGPGTGLHEPGRGVGRLWRENAEVRACLGYATDAVETAFTIVVQPFRRASFDNLLIAATTPEGRFIYALYSGFLGSSSYVVCPSLCRPDYERYPVPAR